MRTDVSKPNSPNRLVNGPRQDDEKLERAVNGPREEGEEGETAA